MKVTKYRLQSTLGVWLCLSVVACGSETPSTMLPTTTAAPLAMPTEQPVSPSVSLSHTPEISSSSPSPVTPGNGQLPPTVSMGTLTPLGTTCIPFRPSGWWVYTVQQGDNLFRLGLNGGKTAEELMVVNCLPSTVIFPGQTLFIPPVTSPGGNPPPAPDVTNTPISMTPPDTSGTGGPPGPPPCGTPPSTPCGGLDPTDTPEPQETPSLTLTPPDNATVVPQPFVQQP